MTPLKFLSTDEFSRLQAKRSAELAAYDVAHPGETEWTPEKIEIGRRHFPPGTIWGCPWYHDPTKAEHVARSERFLAEVKDWGPNGDQRPYLSMHYHKDWAKIRPPLCVVLPNYGEWVIDSRSSNGTGWKITGWKDGDVSQLVASPSINYTGSATFQGYHGWLGCNGAPPGFLSNPV